MRAVGIKVLKNRLSEFVRLAAQGETVLVTDRERVVAELVPPRTGRALEIADAQLAEAVRRGEITPAAGGASAEPPQGVPLLPLADLLAELAEARAER